MKSSPKRQKVSKRTVLAVLSVVALMGNSPPAWGHGTIAGGGNTTHTCMRALSPRILRIVTPAEACSSFEQGLDLPHNGALIDVVLGPAAGAAGVGTVTLTATADVITAPIVAECPPAVTAAPNTGTFRAVGVTFSHFDDLALAVSLPTSPTTWQVAFIAPAGGAKTVTVRAVCVMQFQQS
jgi:hypothetical protein